MNTIQLEKKRERVRKSLRNDNILPPYGEPLSIEQQKIIDNISNNDFSDYEKHKENKRKETKTYKKRVHKEKEKPILKRERLLYESRKYGILPPIGEELNEQQQKVYNYIIENYNTPIKSFLSSHAHLTTPEYRMWYRAKKSSYKKDYNYDFNIEVEDIVIPEKCPYIDINLSTDICDIKELNYYSIDRIDSTKGYVKGNIQIISKLANTMKNNATIEQLISFAEGVLKQHK